MKAILKYKNGKKALVIVPESDMEKMALDAWSADYEDVTAMSGERAAFILIDYTGVRHEIEADIEE